MTATLDIFGPTARLHHIGIAVASIQAAHPGLEMVHDPIQGVRVAFVRLHDVVIEYIEPASDDSPVRRSVEKGIKLVHTCFEVDDLEDALRRARASGFLPISPPAPAVAFAGRRIAWVAGRHVGLVELLESGVDSARA